MPSDNIARISRRALLKGTAAAGSLAAAPALAAPRVAPGRRPTDVTIKEVRFAFEDHLFDRAVLYVGQKCGIRNRCGALAAARTEALENGEQDDGDDDPQNDVLCQVVQCVTLAGRSRPCPSVRPYTIP